MADMPEKAREAYGDWKAGKKYREIAKKYAVSESTVKSWAARYWKPLESSKSDKKGRKAEKKVATKDATKCGKRLQPTEPKKPGAPKGNTNAAGPHKGNCGPPGNTNALRHGAYARLAGELLDENEKEIFNDAAGMDVLAELRQNYAALEVREYRLMIERQKYVMQLNISDSGMMTSALESSREVQAFGQLEDKNILKKDAVIKMLRHSADEANQYYDEDSPRYKDGGFVLLTDRSDDSLLKTIHTRMTPIIDYILKIDAAIDRIQGRKHKILAEIAKISGDTQKFALDKEKHEFDREKYQHQLAVESGEGKKDVSAEWVAAVLASGDVSVPDEMQ